jgi:L-2-hydroxyglutarate oxidase LhgO
MSYEVEAVVIGAGVVGLAVARALAMAGRETLVLEAEPRKGLHASSRNTGVIHAGIGYTPGSLKARLCLDGKELLYAYCSARAVPHRRIGKLLVSPPGMGESAFAYLGGIVERSRAAGLDDLTLLSATQVAEREPQIVCSAGLWSPSSGIVDPEALMDALAADIEAYGGALSFRSPVLGGALEDGRIALDVGDADRTRIRCRMLVNAAGFDSPLLAARLPISGREPPRILSKGTYFALRGPAPFKHLIYPAPHGVHASLDLAGQVRFGPDSELVDRVDYRLDESRLAHFVEGVKSYWPDVRADDFMPGWTAIRARISTGGAKDTDFAVNVRDAGEGCRIVNLFGVDSPGLTASLALAREVMTRLGLPAAAMGETS